MRKILLLLSITMASFACNNDNKKLQEMRTAAINSGIRVDTIMFGLCFSDSPEIVEAKMKNTGYVYCGDFRYNFPDKRIINMDWTNYNVTYENDSLCKFHISSFNDCYNWKEVIKELYSHKYGTPIKLNDTYYWFCGNLEISLYESKEAGSFGHWKSITYRDNTPKSGNYTVLDKDHNFYTYDYWMKYVKPKEDEALKSAGRDI